MAPLGHARQIHTNYIGPFMFYPFLALDVNGKRFCNETVPMSSLNISMSATYKPEDRGIHYRIFDSKTEGAVEGIPGVPPVALVGEGSAWMDPETVVSGNTLEELCEVAGIPVQEGVASIERYNELCAKGTDDDFGVAGSDMAAIDTPPFFCIKGDVGISGINAGIMVDNRYRVTDGEGNVLQHNEPNEVRQVVSAQTSERCRAILEKVVDGGTGKNARVEGYRIGGKTGSSETLETDHTIVSFLGFAPADDPQVIILLAYDNPKPAFPGSNTTAGGWYISGGNMAALMAGELLEDILGHLGVEKTYTANADVLVPNLSGLNLADATSALQKNSLTLRTVGDGGTVTGQIPAAGASIPGGSQVVLYMGEAVPTDQVQVPSVIGLTAEQARQKLADAGLYMRATGATEYGSHVVAYEQSTAAGASVNRGTTIEVRFTDSTASGAGL